MDDLLSNPDIETVFKVEPPITPVPGAYGYAGVFLRNTVTDTVQCHVCGKWFKSVSGHARSAHNLGHKEYKKLFQLPLMLPLVSRSTSAKISSAASKPDRIKQARMWAATGLQKHQRRAKREVFLYAYNNAAFLNKKGICDKQIMRRFLIVADQVGRTPSGLDLRNHDLQLYKQITRRYGGLNKYKLANNFDVNKAPPGKYTDTFLIAYLRNFYKKYKRVPAMSDLDRNGNPSREAYQKHFGSWRRALNMAGFDRKPGSHNASVKPQKRKSPVV